MYYVFIIENHFRVNYAHCDVHSESIFLTNTYSAQHRNTLALTLNHRPNSPIFYCFRLFYTHYPSTISPLLNQKIFKIFSFNTFYSVVFGIRCYYVECVCVEYLSQCMKRWWQWWNIILKRKQKKDKCRYKYEGLNEDETFGIYVQFVRWIYSVRCTSAIELWFG